MEDLTISDGGSVEKYSQYYLSFAVEYHFNHWRFFELAELMLHSAIVELYSRAVHCECCETMAIK